MLTLLSGSAPFPGKGSSKANGAQKNNMYNLSFNLAGTVSVYFILGVYYRCAIDYPMLHYINY